MPLKRKATPLHNETQDHWYSHWFNTDFYHLLYKGHDYQEARVFMDKITSYLNLPEEGSILDVACGRGRHSIYLNSLGYNVTGIDISEKSIQYAQKYENPTLKFELHDMCETFPKQFDAVFNLFTSFGYFEDDEDNLTALKAFKANLNEVGFGVIDFMNVNWVINNLVPNETKTVEGIDFHIQKYFKDNYIYKEIFFEFEGKAQHFTERVKALNLEDFERLFEKADIYLLDIFGDYKLNKFDSENSERLIMIFK